MARLPIVFFFSASWSKKLIEFGFVEPLGMARGEQSQRQ